MQSSCLCQRKQIRSWNLDLSLKKRDRRDQPTDSIVVIYCMIKYNEINHVLNSTNTATTLYIQQVECQTQPVLQQHYFIYKTSIHFNTHELPESDSLRAPLRYPVIPDDQERLEQPPSTSETAYPPSNVVFDSLFDLFITFFPFKDSESPLCCYCSQSREITFEIFISDAHGDTIFSLLAPGSKIFVLIVHWKRTAPSHFETRIGLHLLCV